MGDAGSCSPVTRCVLGDIVLSQGDVGSCSSPWVRYRTASSRVSRCVRGCPRVSPAPFSRSQLYVPPPARPSRPFPSSTSPIVGWGQLSGRGVNVGRIGHGMRLTAACVNEASRDTGRESTAVTSDRLQDFARSGQLRGRVQGSAEPGRRRGYAAIRGVCGVP